VAHSLLVEAAELSLDEFNGMKRHIAYAFGIALLARPPLAVASTETGLVDAARRNDSEVARSLLNEGTDVNARHPDGSTALTWATYHDNVELVDRLIAAGANVNAASEYGETPLSVACANRNLVLARRLLHAGADPNSANPSGETVLMAVADMGTGEVALAALLIAGGANVDARETTKGQTALMWAAVRGDLPVAEILIAAGADIHARTTAGSTPLHFAVQQGALPVAQLLLEKGADPNATLTIRQIDQETQAYVEVLASVTPLWLATTIRHEALAELLLRHGADPNAGQYRNIQPLHFAVQGGMVKFVESLLAYGADPDARAPLTAFPPRGAEENLIGHKTFYLMPVGATPFFIAAQIRDPAMMRALLNAGANPRIVAADGTTPLMAAAGVVDERYRQPAPRQRPQPEHILEAVALALSHDGAINAANELGQTPLHGAAGTRSSALVQFLIDKGADVAAENASSLTPLDIAERDLAGATGAAREQAERVVALLSGPTVATTGR
jgi:ankyrin repeat protein